MGRRLLRDVLTALAAVSAVSVPALAGVADTGEPDPIFALIDAARLAKAAHIAALPSESAAQKQAYAIRDADYGGDRSCNLETICPALKAAREKVETLCDIECRAEDAVIDAKPRTLAGLIAQLIFAAEYLAEMTMLAEDGPIYSDEGRLLPLLVNAARMIDGPLSQRSGSRNGWQKFSAETLRRGAKTTKQPLDQRRPAQGPFTQERRRQRVTASAQ
jgi:hypothetical protein